MCFNMKCRQPDDDDDDFGGSNFEIELANMDLHGADVVMGEGPETQQTCVKWVSGRALTQHRNRR